jgi:hypothetical protein
MAAQPENGHYLVGELIGHAPGKEWKDRSGNVRQPYEVKLLVGQQVLAVQYQSEGDARTVIGKGEPRTVVTARVFVRIVTGKGSPWLSYSGAVKPATTAAA